MSTQLGSSTPRSEHVAAGLLVLACLFWGFSFVWAKNVGEAVNDVVGHGQGGLFGPVGGLTLRFTLSAVLWFAFVKASRSGWTRDSFKRGAILGTFLAAATITQHFGLDRTSEAVAAFLTSLTVVFVPLLAYLVYRKRLNAIIGGGVMMAMIGVWMMTGSTPNGFGTGELLCLICSVLWACYYLAIDRYGKTEHPARLVGASFVANAFFAGIAAIVLGGGPMESVPKLIDASYDPRVWQNTIMLTLFATLGAFGIITYQQPKVDPTRASLLYLSEPIFAAIFAWAWAGSAMSRVQVYGAGLILVANVLVEVLSSRSKPKTIESTNTIAPAAPPG